jgi:protein O-GlcNAc transferase
MSDFEALIRHLRAEVIPATLFCWPWPDNPTDQARLLFWRAWGHGCCQRPRACAQVLAQLESLSIQPFPRWQRLLLHLLTDPELPVLAQLCHQILTCFHTPLSRQGLAAFLARYLPGWNHALLQTGAALVDPRLPLRLSSPEARAWVALAAWQGGQRIMGWRWLQQPEVAATAPEWLLRWVRQLFADGQWYTARRLLSDACARQHKPEHLLLALAALHESQGDYQAALACYTHLPFSVAAVIRQAECLKALGDSDRALVVLQTALKQAAAPEPHRGRVASQALICAASLPDQPTPLMAALEARAVALYQPTQALPLLPPRSGGPIRLAYLSPDLCAHAGLPLWESLLRYHDRTRFEVRVYSATPQPDQATAHLRALSEHWQDVAEREPAEVAALIAADQPQILIDLSGHTSLSQLGVLAFQPAPIQLTGLGFNGPVNLPWLQGRFSDAICTPEGALTLGSWIFAAPPPVTLSPPSAPFQLGCLHHPGRITSTLCQLWAELLRQLPEARLWFKHACFASAQVRAVFVARFVALGIGPERLAFAGASPYPEYLAFYNQLALVLDAAPYHGGMSSCDALWMGVPLLALHSPMRGALSLLTQIGHPAWYAEPAAYVQTALQLLATPLTLAVREALRAQALTAPFSQPVQRVREIEAHCQRLLGS